MLHIGHILLFKRAKDLGDFLIVAVQDNFSVLKYKPNISMVYSTEERLYMVSAIKYVDEVVAYQDVDNDIRTINFDILVCGEDQLHLGFQRAMEWCRQNQKEVVILPRTEGISSTLLRKISKNNNL